MDNNLGVRPHGSGSALWHVLPQNDIVFVAIFNEDTSQLMLWKLIAPYAILRIKQFAPARQTLDQRQGGSTSREKAASYLAVMSSWCNRMEQSGRRRLVWWVYLVTRFSKGVMALVPPNMFPERQADVKG